MSVFAGVPDFLPVGCEVEMRAVVGIVALTTELLLDMVFGKLHEQTLVA